MLAFSATCSCIARAVPSPNPFDDVLTGLLQQLCDRHRVIQQVLLLQQARLTVTTMLRNSHGTVTTQAAAASQPTIHAEHELVAEQAQTPMDEQWQPIATQKVACISLMMIC